MFVENLLNKDFPKILMNEIILNNHKLETVDGSDVQSGDWGAELYMQEPFHGWEQSLNQRVDGFLACAVGKKTVPKESRVTDERSGIGNCWRRGNGLVQELEALNNGEFETMFTKQNYVWSTLSFARLICYATDNSHRKLSQPNPATNGRRASL